MLGSCNNHHMSRDPANVTGRIDVYVQPRASKSEIVGMHAEALKIRLAAAPVEGAANEALVDLIARRLGLAKNAVRIVAGAHSRRKTVEVAGWSTERVRAALLAG
jgi:uncharacterized protein